MLLYLNEHPPANEILIAVHDVKIKSRKFKLVDEKEFESEFYQLPVLMGAPEKLSSDFKDNVSWAREEMEKLKKQKAN